MAVVARVEPSAPKPVVLLNGNVTLTGSAGASGAQPTAVSPDGSTFFVVSKLAGQKPAVWRVGTFGTNPVLTPGQLAPSRVDAWKAYAADFGGVTGVVIGDDYSGGGAPVGRGWVVSSGGTRVVIAPFNPDTLQPAGAALQLDDQYGPAAAAQLLPDLSRRNAPQLVIATRSVPYALLRVAPDKSNHIVASTRAPSSGQVTALTTRSDGTVVYVASATPDSTGAIASSIVTAYDAATLTPLGDDDLALPYPGRFDSAVTSPDGRFGYFARSSTVVDGVAQPALMVKVDLAAMKVLGTATLPSSWREDATATVLQPNALAIQPDGSQIIYTTYEAEGGTAGIIDAATLKFVTSRTWYSTGLANLHGMSSPLADGGIDMFTAAIDGNEVTGSALRFQIAQIPRQLTALTAGTGGGLIESIPGGVLCAPGLDCRQRYPNGSVVQLVAIPNPGAVFLGWSGACTGTDDDCSVTMDAAKSVTANFGPADPARRSFDVLVEGNGSVTSSVDGSVCTRACTTSLWRGLDVTLTATPAVGYVFDHWEGSCSGTTSTCETTIDGTKVVAAVFTAVAAPPEPAPTPTPEPTPSPAPTPSPLVGPSPSSTDPAADVSGPVALTGLAVSRKSFRPGQGTTIKYRLTRGARVWMTFVNQANPKLKKVYSIRSGQAGADAGANAVWISGRVKGTSVRPGRWTVTIVAQTSSGSSKPVSRTLVLRPGK
jgi:hypothetical protein